MVTIDRDCFLYKGANFIVSSSPSLFVYIICLPFAQDSKSNLEFLYKFIVIGKRNENLQALISISVVLEKDSK